MVGMLQILTYLLCVYLIFKGVEIFQIAFMSNRESRAAGMILGGLAIMAAVACAGYFAYLSTDQALSLQRSLQFGRP